MLMSLLRCKCSSILCVGWGQRADGKVTEKRMWKQLTFPSIVVEQWVTRELHTKGKNKDEQWRLQHEY